MYHRFNFYKGDLMISFIKEHRRQLIIYFLRNILLDCLSILI